MRKIKILLVGNQSAGKSQFLQQYMNSNFELTTIGSEFKEKEVILNDKAVTLQIWDTAGQENYKTLTNAYYKGIHAVVLMYNINNRQSFNDLKRWRKEVISEINNVAIVVVGICAPDKVKVLTEDQQRFGGNFDNAIPIQQKREVISTQEGQQYATDIDAFCHFEVSMTDRVNIEKIFETTANLVYNHLQKIEEKQNKVESNNNDTNSNDNSVKKNQQKKSKFSIFNWFSKKNNNNGDDEANNNSNSNSTMNNN